MGINWGTTGIPYKRRSKKNKIASLTSSRKPSPIEANAPGVDSVLPLVMDNEVANNKSSECATMTPITNFFASVSSLDAYFEKKNTDLKLSTKSEFQQNTNKLNSEPLNNLNLVTESLDDFIPEKRTLEARPLDIVDQIEKQTLKKRPRVQYGFGVSENETYEKEQLKIYQFAKSYQHSTKMAINSHDIPKQKRETVEQYLHAIKAATPSPEQAAIVENQTKKGEVQRIRRVRDEGSYAWNSVDEEKMLKNEQHILRYTWKGKLIKLKNYLDDDKHHKDINRQDNCGRTACHFAASWDCYKTLSVLVEVPGVDLDIQDDEGKTPLHKAVEANSINGVRLLIQHGANPLIKAHDNRNPFEVALQDKGDTALEIIKYLYVNGEMFKERKGNGVLNHLHQICLATKDAQVVKTAMTLMNFGENVNATEGLGRTPLMLAAQFQREDLVELFLRCKSEVKHVDLDHKTALQYTKPGERCYDLIRNATTAIYANQQ